MNFHKKKIIIGQKENNLYGKMLQIYLTKIVNLFIDIEIIS